MITERFRLDGRHVRDVLGDLLFVVVLARAWERAGQAAIWEAGWIVHYHFAKGDGAVLEAHAVTALKDPTLKLVIAVLDLAARFNTKELWMDSPSIQEHRVGVRIGGLGWIDVGFEWIVHDVWFKQISG